jgi:hypothetical protein
LRTRIRALATAMATAALLVAGMASPAQAARAHGQCSVGGYWSDAWVSYRNVGTQHGVYGYEWDIHGVAGSTKNNVVFQLKRGSSLLHGWSSPDNLKTGYNYHTIDPELRYPTSWAIYADFRVDFDVNNQRDPYCTGSTASF